MSLVVVHNSPHITITRSLSQSSYDNFKLLKNLVTTRRLKWEERKSYRSRRLSYRSRTNVVASRAFSAPCQTRRHSTSCYELCTSCYELLRYNTILKPSSDEFTTIFLRVSAIIVRLSTSCLQISTSRSGTLKLPNRLANVRRIWNRKERH